MKSRLQQDQQSTELVHQEGWAMMLQFLSKKKNQDSSLDEGSIYFPSIIMDGGDSNGKQRKGQS